jgi:hypothetical protein
MFSRSRGRESRSRLSAPGRLTSPGVCEQPSVDHIRELAFQGPHRLAVGLAFGALAFEVGLAGTVVADLGDRSDVDDAVELTVQCGG